MTEPSSRSAGDGEPFRLLFVCTGNTCRSPMAESLAQAALTRRGWREVEVRSAGVAAAHGAAPSQGAVRALARRDLAPPEGGSRPLTAPDVEDADLILTMSPTHLEVVRILGGEDKAELVTSFAEGREGLGSREPGVSDPVGADDAIYEEVCLQLEELVEQILDRLEPVLRP